MSGRPPRIAVTGYDGFVGWHLRCAFRARFGTDVIGIGMPEYADRVRMAQALAGADAVIHLAGVNRAVDELEISRTNPWLAGELVAALDQADRVIPVVYGNSIHSKGTSVFGIAKQKAADILAAWGVRSGAPIVDVLMPNLFGEHGMPHYNSVVATFSHLIAKGQDPVVVDDKVLPLLHAQAMADILLDHALAPASGRVEVPGKPVLVSTMLEQLQDMAKAYQSGVLPDLSEEFTRDLFNTYRSATFPRLWPIHPTRHSDPRGSLVEAVKCAGGQTQVFYSTTNPGYTRGQHWHRRKVERFMVLSGQADITLRRLFTDEVITFSVSGEVPAIVDMPTMWAHAITNTGADQLVTLFYADEVFNPEHPDTIPETVAPPPPRAQV